MSPLGWYPALPIEAARHLCDEARFTLKCGIAPSLPRREREHLGFWTTAYNRLLANLAFSAVGGAARFADSSA